VWAEELLEVLLIKVVDALTAKILYWHSSLLSERGRGVVKPTPLPFAYHLFSYHSTNIGIMTTRGDALWRKRAGAFSLVVAIVISPSFPLMYSSR